MIVWDEIVRFMDWFCLKGPGYQFWSGIGISICMPLVWLRHHNCCTKWCPFPGHADDQCGGLPHCRIHHSSDPATR